MDSFGIFPYRFSLSSFLCSHIHIVLPLSCIPDIYYDCCLLPVSGWDTWQIWFTSNYQLRLDGRNTWNIKGIAKQRFYLKVHALQSLVLQWFWWTRCDMRKWGVRRKLRLVGKEVGVIMIRGASIYLFVSQSIRSREKCWVGFFPCIHGGNEGFSSPWM